MTTYIGIDPGITGAFAYICDKGAVARPLPMFDKTLDVPELALWIQSLTDYGNPFAPPIVAVLEQAQSMPKQGIVSAFNYGVGFGSLKTVLTMLKVRLELVRPTAWKKVVLAGTDKDKDAAISYCARAFPGVRLVQEGCRVPHDGCADALCLAEYGRRTYASASEKAHD